MVVQLLGFGSGILLVRVLSKQQYAYFTIGASMLTMMGTLADSGITSALSAIGGRIHDDARRFGSLVNTALRLRRVFALVSIGVVMPLLVVMLLKNSAPAGETAGIACGILLAAYFQLAVGVYAIVPRLTLRTRQVQNLDLAAALLRLCLLVLAWVFFLNASVAVIIGALTLALQYFLLRRWVVESIDIAAPPSAEYQAGIVKIVRRQAPNTIYFCLHGQLSIWLISFFGSTSNVAEIGALGRLGMIFSVLSSIMAGVVLPRFARCRSPVMLRRRYWQILSGYAAFGAVLIGVAAMFPSELLWILGKQYSGLKAEVVLMVVSAVIAAIDVAMYSMTASRGWIVSPWIEIPTGLVSQIVLLLIIDISTVRGVLLLGIFFAIPHMLVKNWNAMKGMKALAESEAEESRKSMKRVI